MTTCQQSRSTVPPLGTLNPSFRRLPRRAAVTIELALVAPAFFFLVFGIIEVGRGFMVSHLLANAARDGCRAGVIMGTSTTHIEDLVNKTLTAQGVSGASVSVRIDGEEKEATTAASGSKISVSVSIPVKDFTWMPGGAFLKGSLGGEYSLYRE
jgi:Flp pilus assembly protein TadG